MLIIKTLRNLTLVQFYVFPLMMYNKKTEPHGSLCRIGTFEFETEYKWDVDCNKQFCQTSLYERLIRERCIFEQVNL